MIVHADLALLTSRGVDALISAYVDRRRVQGDSLLGFVRCKDGTGTNVVLVDPRQPFSPAFGPASFAAHQLAAGSRGYELRSDEAAFDVDTVADLRRLARAMVPARLLPFVAGSHEADPMALLDVPCRCSSIGLQSCVMKGTTHWSPIRVRYSCRSRICAVTYATTAPLPRHRAVSRVLT